MAKKKDKKEKEEEATEEKEAEPEKKEAPAEGEEAAEGAEGAEGEGAPKKGKRKLLIIIVGAVVVLALIGGGGFMLLGHKKKDAALTPEQAAAAVVKPVYYELPEFLVNLNTASGGRASFIKMSVTLELKDQTSVAIIDANKPRILDTFNTYLHELRPADVQGSAGIYRLRQELMARINGTVQEGVVKDILFSEIIVQ